MIAAVVVTYSAPSDLLGRCVDALASTEGLDRVVVVDTGGDADPPGYDGLVRLVLTDNRGFGDAVNAGWAHVGDAEFVMILNDDAIVRPGWLAPMLAEFDDRDVGAVQPVLVGADGAVASLGVRIDRYGAGTDVGDGTAVDDLVGDGADLSVFTGGAVMVRRAYWRDCGGFDDRWFLYYEDVDLARRGATRGWKYRLATASRVEHERGTSTNRDADRTRYLQERNRLWYAARWEAPRVFSAALWLSVRRLRHRPRRLHARALAAGLAGVPVRLVERRRVGRSTR